MRQVAVDILSELKKARVEVNHPKTESILIESIESKLLEMDVLLAAVKREILHVNNNENLGLEEEDANEIASTMVFDRDWSSFNEWIAQEIVEYKEEKGK